MNWKNIYENKVKPVIKYSAVFSTGAVVGTAVGIVLSFYILNEG